MKKLCLSLVLILLFLTACANENPTGSNTDSITESSELEIESSAASSEEDSEETSTEPSEEESSIASEEESTQESENETSSEEENQEKVALVLEKVWIEQETDWISTEHREYNNGYRLDIRTCYESEPDSDRVSNVETAFSQNGKYLYRYREVYDEKGEVISRTYYTYGNPNLGERLAFVDMTFDFYGYEGANRIDWSEKGRDNGSFSYRNDGTFSYELKDKDGTITTCYYLEYKLFYCTKVSPIEGDTNNRITEYYNENMELIVRYTPTKYTEYFLDDGKILRTVSQKDSYVRALYLYTEPSNGAEPELEYIATYSTNTDQSNFWVQILGDDITQEQAEEYCRIVTTTEKSLKPLQDKWLDAYYRPNENNKGE